MGLVPNIVSFDTKEIVEKLPEYKGMLIGDRALNAVFDNSKLLQAIPGFKFDVTIDKGIERVIEFWEMNGNYDYDYCFDARVDRLICSKAKVGFVYYSNARSSSKTEYLCYRYLPLRIASRVLKWC